MTYEPHLLAEDDQISVIVEDTPASLAATKEFDEELLIRAIVQGEPFGNLLLGTKGNGELAGSSEADIFLLAGNGGTIRDFGSMDGDIISVIPQAYGIESLSELEYVEERIGDRTFGQLRVKATGDVLATLDNMDGETFDIEKHVVLSRNVFSEHDAFDDNFIKGNDNDNLIIVDDGSYALIGGGGTDVFVLDGGNFHHILDFDLEAGEKIRISTEAYGITGIEDLGFEYVSETAFRITINDYIFAGVQHVEPGLRIDSLTDIVELF